MKTYYDILEVTNTASDAVIKASYRTLINKYHPDKSIYSAAEAEQMSKLLNEAYSVLSDSIRRKMYDEELKSNNTPPETDFEDFEFNRREASADPTQPPPKAVIEKKNWIPVFAVLFFILVFAISYRYTENKSTVYSTVGAEKTIQHPCIGLPGRGGAAPVEYTGIIHSDGSRLGIQRLCGAYSRHVVRFVMTYDRWQTKNGKMYNQYEQVTEFDCQWRRYRVLKGIWFDTTLDPKYTSQVIDRFVQEGKWLEATTSNTIQRLNAICI